MAEAAQKEGLLGRYSLRFSVENTAEPATFGSGYLMLGVVLKLTFIHLPLAGVLQTGNLRWPL